MTVPSNPGSKKIEYAGQTLTLLPERCLYYDREKTLMVADVHVGKDTTFRRSGIAVPEAVAESDFARLTSVLERTGARKLILLGDFQHARLGMTDRTRNRVKDWRNRHLNLEIVLVMGNHDRASGTVSSDWGFEVVNGAYDLEPFQLTHEPPSGSRRFSICGHIHPSVRIFGRGSQSEKLSCFFLQNKLLILPAFGSFTGTKKMEPKKGSVAYAIAGDTIIEYCSDMRKD